MFDVFLKVCALAGIGAFSVVLLRKYLPEMSVAVNVALVAVLAFLAGGCIKEVIDFVYRLADGAGIEIELIRPLIKTLGISITAKMAGDICRDCGVSAAASYTELVGGAVAVLTAIPLVTALLRQINV